MRGSSENIRIAKNTFFLYVRMAILLIVGLYTSRVTLTALGISDYGIFNVVGGVVTMFTFINNAMVNSTQRYITYELGTNNKNMLSEIFSTSIIIHIVISIIIIILSETVGLWFLQNKMIIPNDREDAAFWIFQFSIISCVITILSTPYNALIIAHEKMDAFAFISLLDAFLKLAIVIFLLNYEGDRLVIYSALCLIIVLMDLLIYKIYCNKYFRESCFKIVFNKSLLKEMSSFASWNLLGNFSYICYTQGLNLLLNVFFNPIINAARGISVQIQTVVSNFSYNIENAIKPQITKSYAHDDSNRMYQLITISARSSFFVLWLISLPLMLELDAVLAIWLVEIPDHTANFVRLTLTILLVDSLTGPLLTAVQATGELKKYQMIVSVFCLSILPLSYLALRIVNVPEIIYIINLLVFVLIQIAKLSVVSNQINIKKWSYIKDVIFRCIAVVLISIIAPLIIWCYATPSIIRLLLISIISVLSILISVYSIGLSLNERRYINTKMKYLSLLQKKV